MKGHKIRSLAEFSKQNNIVFHDKTINKLFFRNWQYNYIIGQIELGTLYTWKPNTRRKKLRVRT